MKVAFLTSIRQLYPPLSQLLLLDNSYCSADSRHSAALRQLYRPTKAIITIYLLDNSYSNFRTLLLYICGASVAAIYFHATKPI
ncbi:MAG: hypothetical protein SWX82_21070 [Cyanobacteriota bacterium]|nr:hypothetical protein [Cyanobacteriota bacterium]